LIAGGLFALTTPTGHERLRVARWDGGSWHRMGEEGMDGAIWTLGVHDGDLVAGGAFTTAGGRPVNHIAR
jgi:hypothetical protein